MSTLSRDLDIISIALPQTAGIGHQPVMQAYICVSILYLYHNVAVEQVVKIVVVVAVLGNRIVDVRAF